MPCEKITAVQKADSYLLRVKHDISQGEIAKNDVIYQQTPTNTRETEGHESWIQETLDLYYERYKLCDCMNRMYLSNHW